MRGKTTEKTKELNNKIVELYENGLSKDKIASQLFVGTKYVREYLNQIGLNRHQNSKIVDKEKLEKLLKDEKTIKEISKKLQLSVDTISKYVRIYNLRKCKCTWFDDSVFEKIDTEEKAYWLGFIYADGCVYKNTLEITLSEKDLHHLQKFSNFLNAKKDCIKKVCIHLNSNDKTYFAYKLSVYSKKICCDLNNLGVHPKKSFTTEFPTERILPKELIPHFIRGYFDGDGSIMSQETSKVKLAISIIGNHSFIHSLSKILNGSTIIKHKGKTGNMYYLNFKILKSIKFCEFIYTHATIYMDRKKNIWDNFCRSNVKMLEGLRGKFGENWDVNAEVIDYVNYKRYCNA